VELPEVVSVVTLMTSLYELFDTSILHFPALVYGGNFLIFYFFGQTILALDCSLGCVTLSTDMDA
jgi:hypothetical protein